MSIRQYWFVLWELTKRELKRKYARSFLGILWSCVYPLMRMALVVVLFSCHVSTCRVLKADNLGVFAGY